MTIEEIEDNKKSLKDVRKYLKIHSLSRVWVFILKEDLVSLKGQQKILLEKEVA